MRRAIAVLAVLALGLCYASTIGGMVHQWWTDEDMGYAFLVPFVIAWVVWRERGRWRKLPVQRRCWRRRFRRRLLRRRCEWRFLDCRPL